MTLIDNLYQSLFSYISKTRISCADTPTLTIHSHLIVTLCTSILMWAYTFNAVFNISTPIPGIIGIICSTTHLLTPLLFRVSNRYILITSLMLGAGILHQSTYSYYTGGFNSHVLIWISILPFLAGIIAGAKAAKIWFTITLTTSVLFLYLHFAVGPLQSYLTEKGYLMGQGLIIFGYIFLNSALILVFLSLVQKSKDELKTKNSKIKNLIKVLCHDVCNSLGVISNTLTLIANPDRNKKDDEEVISLAERGCHTIVDIINHARTLNSSNMDETRFQLKAVNLNDSIRSVYSLLRDRYESKSIKLNYDYEANKDIYIYTDQLVFQIHILSNLLTNSLKFSYFDNQVDIKVISTGERVQISIIDYGVGIHPRIFENLYSFEVKMSTEGTLKERGTGYGMSIVKSYMDSLGAKLTIVTRHEDYSTNHGTKYILDFPRA